ncbi:MAG: PaaI family thioesterase [Candidatus Kariarchaeaceae archaeon]|jgi:uncharacterized protein (TIGR00369 family)
MSTTKIMEQHYRKLENMYHNHNLNAFFQAQVRISHENAVLTIPISEKLFHAANATHGAVYFKALDDAAFFAANSVEMEVFVLTSSFTIYLTKAIITGEMKAVGKLCNKTGSQLIAEAILYDSQDNEIARGSGVYIRSKIKLTEEMGYLV